MAHIIKLTAENVQIDEAVIRELIAANITVSMLKASEIDTDKFHVKSNDGSLEIVGNTMQFKDQNDVVRIQIGRDTNNNFTFCLYDETGKGVLIDSSGIKESAISDGLIKNDMVANGTLGKEKFNFNIVEADENGNIDAGKVLINGKEFTCPNCNAATITKEVIERVVGDSIKIKSIINFKNRNKSVEIYASDSSGYGWIIQKQDDGSNRFFGSREEAEDDCKKYNALNGVQRLIEDYSNRKDRILD